MYASPPRLLVSFTLTHLTYSQFQIINELSNLYLETRASGGNLYLVI